MAGDAIKGDQSGNILVDFDYNNIILVDPNKIKDSKGKISERLVDHENMVMYANLEAELLPRTKLNVGSSPDKIRTISIAKLNFLKPNNGREFTTQYYDELTGKGTTRGNGSNQVNSTYIPPSNGERGYNRLDVSSDGGQGSIDNGLLGITSINVKISGSFIPEVTMTLEDVQGRALFQLGENSPYSAFFHMPYPPFYLTLKGYFGQAVRYQLNLTKFNADFNSMGGNYRINLEFQGYKYNILNEITMGFVMGTPHMYSSRFDISNSTSTATPSSSLKAQASQQSEISRNSSNSKQTVVKQMFVEKGYQKILEVYNEYKVKGLIDKNLPELTIQQLMNKLQKFEDTILDNFKKADVQPLTDIRNYQEKLKNIYGIVYSDANSFFSQYVNPKPFIGVDGTYYYAYKDDINAEKQLEVITKVTGDIGSYNKVLDENPTLGKDGKNKITNKITASCLTATTTPDKIDWERTTTEQDGIVSPTVFQVEQLISRYKNLFKPKVVGSVGDVVKSVFSQSAPGEKFTTAVNKTPSITIEKPYFFVIDGKDRFKQIVNEMNAIANKILSEYETKITKELRDKIEDKKTGLGFTPTVRNIIAIIMASAEGFIRLLDDVHTKAWNVRLDPVRKSAILNNTSSVPSVETKNVVQTTTENSSSSGISQIPVFPWPQYFVESLDEKNKYQIKYPGDPSEINRTQAYNYDKWPEVEFVEELINGITKTNQAPSDPTPNDVAEFSPLLNINAIEFPQSDVIYANKQEIKYFYEIWERQFLTSRYENYARITEKSGSEFENLIQLISDVESSNILDTLGVSNPSLNMKLKEYAFKAEDYIASLKSFSRDGHSDSWKNFIKDIFVTPYIKSITEQPNRLLTTENLGKQTTSKVDRVKLENIIKSTYTNVPIILDTAPFTNEDWVSKNVVDKANQNSLYNTTKTLFINEQTNIISDFNDINNYTTNRPVTNFSYMEVSNPLAIANAYSPQSLTSFIKDFYYKRTPSQFVPTEGFCYFTTPKNQNATNFGLITPNLPIRTTTSMLNTPFFINSIVEGVAAEKSGLDYPYLESSYLFINSLPLISLRERLKTKGTGLNDLDYMFINLKKFAAIHKLPYAWILKIGSLWYRYKSFMQTGNDILSSTIWADTDYKKNFDPVSSNPQKKYVLTVNGKTGTTIQLEAVTTNATSIQTGFFPKLIDEFNYFYRGYSLYNTFSDQEIQESINGGLKLFNFTKSNLNLNQIVPPSIIPTTLNLFTWSVLLPGDNKYYTVPSWGGDQNQIIDSMVENNGLVAGSSLIGNPSVYNGSTRLLWNSPNYGYFDKSQIKKPNYTDYLNKIDGDSSNLSPFALLNKDEYSKIEDIFSVFDKSMLDTFETEFLNFSKSAKNAQTLGKSQSILFKDPANASITFTNFQLLFRNLMTLRTKNNKESEEQYFTNSITEQFTIYNNIIEDFLNYDVILQLGNPSNYDRFIFDSVLLHLSGTPSSLVTYLETPEIFKPYVGGTLPSVNGGVTLRASQALSVANNQAWNELYLSVGFSTINELAYKDSGSYITDFFVDNNIEFTEDNVKKLASIIKIYATQKLVDSKMTPSKFFKLLNDYFNNCNKLQNESLNRVLTKIRKTLPNYSEVPEKTINSSISGNQPKVDIWENLKALNDKWIAGGDFTTKTFLEDILMLDKASRNIGDTLYVDIFSLRDFLSEKSNIGAMSVYSCIANILIFNKFIIMNLPAYVNFYNKQDVDGTNQIKGEGSSEFADKMWGTFLGVDYRESGPKLVCFFTGTPSRYLDLEESKNFLFRSDGIQLDKSNPLNESPEGKKDYALSNRCVGFNVDIGIRNQNVFHSFNVSQAAGKGTSESISTLYNMIQQAGGRNTSTQNVSLYNYYSQRSYGCEVVGFGNAMIQPTMYFNLKHVPMFNGPYFITDVSHVITPGTFQTSFNGTRQGVYDLPSIDTYLQSINQNLLTKLEQLVKNSNEETQTSNSSGLQNNAGQTIQSSSNAPAPANSCKPDTSYTTYVYTAETVNSINQTNLTLAIKRAGVSNELGAAIFMLCYLRTYRENVFNGYNNNYSMVTVNNKYQITLDVNPGFAYKTYSCIASESTNKTTNSIAIINFKTLDLFVGFMKSILQPKINQIKDMGIYKFYYCGNWQDKSINEADFNAGKDSTYKETLNKINLALLLIKDPLTGFDLGSETDIKKFVYGNTYTPTPTPTASPQPVVLPPSTQIFDMQRIKNGTNDIKVIVKIKPNVGLWSIFSSRGFTSSTTVCSTSGVMSSPGVISADNQQITFQPYQEALNDCEDDNVSGQVPMEFRVSANPILANGGLDTTRSQEIYSFQSVITVTATPPNPKGIFVEDYTNPQNILFELYYKQSGFNKTGYAYLKSNGTLISQTQPSSTAPVNGPNSLMSELKLSIANYQ